MRTAVRHGAALRRRFLGRPFFRQRRDVICEGLDVHQLGIEVLREPRADFRAALVKSGLIVGIDLTPQEKPDLVAFLKTLTDETLLTSPRFSDPWSGAAASK